MGSLGEYQMDQHYLHLERVTITVSHAELTYLIVPPLGSENGETPLTNIRLMISSGHLVVRL